MNNKDFWYLCRDWEKYKDEYGIKDLKVIESKLTGAYCNIGRTTDGDIIVRFKGTELKINDIITDLLFKKMVIPYNNMIGSKVKVHLGFITQYLSIQKELLDYISNNKDYELIYFIGHSLGGALATLCILDMRFNFNLIGAVGIIFGSPKVGNKHFRNSFIKRVLDFKSFINVSDIVTKLPLAIMGYRHVENRIKIGKLRWWLPFSIKQHLNYDKYL